MPSPCPLPFPPLYVDLYAGLMRALAAPWLEPWWLDGPTIPEAPARPAAKPQAGAASPRHRPPTDEQVAPAKAGAGSHPPAWRVVEGLDTDPVAARDLADLRRRLRTRRRRRRGVA